MEHRDHIKNNKHTIFDNIQMQVDLDKIVEWAE